MTEKELISKLQGLKQIKPRKDWVVLAKIQILGNTPLVQNEVAKRPVFSDIFFGVLFQRKLAYALAVFLFIFAGVFGFMKYGFPHTATDVKEAQQPAANLVAIKSNVEDFKTKSRNLSEVAQYNPEDIPAAVKEVQDSAKELTDAIREDPQLANAVALEINNNKTYLEITSREDLKETSNTIETLYKTTTEQLLKDYDGVTLIESKQESLDRIKDLFNKGGYEGKYANALEDILLFSAVVDSE